uniref:DNA fragmentation factor subunit alpha n=1 Tax=Loxodonta africana TaxID=9785 RepID=G3U5M0_LOXAF
MEVTEGTGAPEPGEIRALKPCLLRRNHSLELHGVAVSCLEELRSKACDILAIDKSLAPVTLVLAEDGTIVDDDDWSRATKSRTKFVALASNEKWTDKNSEDQICWPDRDWRNPEEPCSTASAKDENISRQKLGENIHASLLTLSQSYQVLIDVPCSDLAQELGQSCAAVQGLQNTLQQVLDQREEARQSKQLLELYIRALEKEGSILSKQEESKTGFVEEVDAVDMGTSRETFSGVTLTSQVLTVLKEKPAPELSLSSQDLELVTKEDPKALAVALNWDKKRTETVQQACEQELSLRLQQIQSLRSLRSVSARKTSRPGQLQSPKRAKQDPT